MELNLCKALSTGKIKIAQKQKIISFLPGKIPDPIHRHVFGRTEIIVDFLFLSRWDRV
jgi:hypothetical protein